MAEEKTREKTSSNRRFVVWLLILIAGLGVGAYALARVLQFVRAPAALPVPPVVAVPARLTAGLMPGRPVNPLIDPAHVPEQAAEPRPVSEAVPEPEMPLPEPAAAEPAADAVPVSLPPEPVSIMPAPDGAPLPAEADPVPVADLLRLREEMRAGLPCRDSMQALMAHPAAFGALIAELKPFCLTDANPHDRLRGDFARARRRILLAHYRAEKPWWKGYARYAGALFVDVRAQHPDGDSVPDLLDAALNALDDARLREASAAVAKLPAAARDELRPVTDMLDGLVRVQGLIDDILTRQAGRGA
ncbi:MAG: hypothetical protein PHX68_01995 [Alphaproteobacteria bacterium]|nr:hypothetical protein [Alphaproteobacteria bacterium]